MKERLPCLMVISEWVRLRCRRVSADRWWLHFLAPSSISNELPGVEDVQVVGLATALETVGPVFFDADHFSRFWSTPESSSDWGAGSLVFSQAEARPTGKPGAGRGKSVFHRRFTDIYHPLFKSRAGLPFSRKSFPSVRPSRERFPAIVIFF
jgi:hypothetical protein